MARRGEATHIVGGLFVGFAYESITVGGTVKSFTESKYTDTDGDRALRAVVTVENARIRYRYDGGNPSSSEGHLLNPGDVLIVINSLNVVDFRVTKVDSGSSTLRITYEK